MADGSECTCCAKCKKCRGHKNEVRYTYEDIEEIAKHLQERTPIRPKIGIICGTGLGTLAEAITDATVFEYKDIPKFPVSTVLSHAGNLVFGLIEGFPVVCMQGRFHYYEGYPLWKCVMPVRIMKLLGVTHLIASNAAGGINKNLKVGDIMLIKDHFNLMGLAGTGPLLGPNDDRIGPRFVPMNNAYDLGLLDEVKSLAKDLGLEPLIKEGVYTCIGGPEFETVAELRALESLGVDAVGMSTVHEIITAKHCGISSCLAFSVISDLCSTEYGNGTETTHDEVVNMANKRASELKLLVTNIVKHIGKNKLK